MLPEDELLYYCALSGASPARLQTLSHLTASIKDWDICLRRTRFHRLQPRLYILLKRNGGPSLVGDPAWKKIESAYLYSQAYVMALEGELTEILLPALNKMNVDVLLLKGAALLQNVYQDKPLRFCVDLDLLVRPNHLSQAEDCLRGLGYHPKRLTHFPSLWHEREIGSKLNREFTWTHPERGILLDLHTDAFDESPFFTLEPNWLWEKASPLDLNGSKAFLPHPNNFILHLLLHLVKHAGASQNAFGWYVDLDESLRYFGSQMDSEALWERIRASSQSNEVLRLLAFLRDHFSTPLPSFWLSRLQEKKARPPSLEEIFPPADLSEVILFKQTDVVDRREQVLFYWSQVRGFRKKFWFLLRWLFPDREYLETKFPFSTRLEQVRAYLEHFVCFSAKGLHLLFHAVLKRDAKTLERRRRNKYTLHTT